MGRAFEGKRGAVALDNRIALVAHEGGLFRFGETSFTPAPPVPRRHTLGRLFLFKIDRDHPLLRDLWLRIYDGARNASFKRVLFV